MIEAKLTRQLSGEAGTFGTLEVLGFTCRTVERPATGPAPCIPAGTYTCRKTWSNRCRADVYEITGVPGRTRILIHAANLASQLLGCVAPGEAVAKIQTADGKLVPGVTRSKATLEQLHKLLAWREFTLTIALSPIYKVE